MGTSGMTSQGYGSENWEDTLRILLRALMIGLGIGVLFIVFQRLIEWGLIRIMNTPASSLHLVSDYFRITIWGAPAMLGLYGLTGWFIGMQNTKVPMLIAIVQNLVNIAASLFSFYSWWKIEGVATGTLVAQWSGFLMGIVILRNGLKHDYFFASERNERITLQLFRSTFRNLGAWKQFLL